MVVCNDLSSERFLRAKSTQPGSSWTYAPRPVARPVRSIAAPPSALRTMRIRPALPASSRQPAHVRTGSCRCFGLICLARLDVDTEACQLGGEPGVLAVPPDSQGQLPSRHQYRRGPRPAVDRNTLRLGG